MGRRIGIYFRGKTYRHNAGTGYNYLWIEVRLRESHELIKVLRDKGFFGRDIEGYLILPEDALKEVLGEDLYNKLLESNDDSEDSGRRWAPAPGEETRGGSL